MRACVLLSGGIDSTTCLGMAVERYGAEAVMALSISYGQKHEKEMQAALAVAEYYHVSLQTLDLAKIFEYSDCSLLAHSDKEIPKGSYSHQIEGIQKIKEYETAPVSTYVPFRNGLFLSGLFLFQGLFRTCCRPYHRCIRRFRIWRGKLRRSLYMRLGDCFHLC